MTPATASMSEPQAMSNTHERCENEGDCEECGQLWPCDAEIGRAALERIEKLAEDWKLGGSTISVLGEAAVTLRAIRDIAREARGEAGS